ncbi:hypothetical protein COV81_02560 [Candidatus Peregrinibacteria bacterium CG11_big_fil_rev_8_21_14_0_20_41_10]|nr:MAG: hypothetical protein COV81_02560 [Candidatus Peregrinibacteria bacterium CG11_big_fil_rev_8_21_14_0_20_41_10]
MFKKYILPLTILFLLGAISTIITLYKLSPCITYDPVNFCKDYYSIAIMAMSLSILLSLTGILSLAGYLIRWRFYRSEIFSNHFNIALRQGFLLSLTVVLALCMMVLSIFRWWSILILIGLIILIEFYFSGRENT